MVTWRMVFPLLDAENPEPGLAGARIVLAEAARDALRDGSL